MPSGRIRRTAPVLGLTARTAGEAVVESLRRRAGRDQGEERRAEFHARTAERYAELLGHSKGVLMKVGQMLSFVSLGRSIPPEYQAIYRQALGRLQADAPPMAPELAAATFEKELGRRPEDVFAEWSAEPLAAASIGQVHAARLADGRRVAVKIQYPGVEQAIRNDLKNDELLTTFFALLRALIPGMVRTDVRAIADEVAERITEELDYVNEARNQSEFARIYKGHPFIRIPDVVPELSTARVLTQELVEGRPWSEALDMPQDLRDRWGEVIYRFSIGSLRRLCIFNADPHPGNYLFHDDGTVSFLDFGCVRRFEPRQVAQMSEMVSAMGRHEVDRVWRAFVDMGAVDPQNGPTPQEVFDWASPGFRLLTEAQPYTVTPEHVAEALSNEYSPTGPSGRVLRAMTIPAHLTFLSRIDTGILALMGELRATGEWLAIQREYDEKAAPITELGISEAPFWDKGLVFDA
ncbi:MAG TPA: AarF/ABC1/UbiB kinase family protein [Acidimicrobiales bacterium]|nr:AarF/ABC1/UbiB kinase family protein [Acidimicrobiales bacterium]